MKTLEDTPRSTQEEGGGPGKHPPPNGKGGGASPAPRRRGGGYTPQWEHYSQNQRAYKFNPRGKLPSIKLNQKLSATDFIKFKKQFIRYVDSGKEFIGQLAPPNRILSEIENCCVPEFFETISDYVTNNYPCNDIIDPNICPSRYVISVIGNFYNDKILLFNRVGPLRRYVWTESENYDQFLNNLEDIFESIDVHSLSIDQWKILVFIDACTNTMLLNKIQKDFSVLAQMPYKQFKDTVRNYTIQFLNQKQSAFTNRGEGKMKKEFANGIEGGGSHSGYREGTICLKCGGDDGHRSKFCKIKVSPCTVKGCENPSHNVVAHQKMVALGIAPFPHRKFGKIGKEEEANANIKNKTPKPKAKAAKKKKRGKVNTVEDQDDDDSDDEEEEEEETERSLDLPSAAAVNFTGSEYVVLSREQLEAYRNSGGSVHESGLSGVNTVNTSNIGRGLINSPNNNPLYKYPIAKVNRLEGNMNEPSSLHRAKIRLSFKGREQQESALADSGASVSLISWKIIQNLKIRQQDLTPSPIKIYAANRELLQHMGVARLEVACLCSRHKDKERAFVDFFVTKILSEKIILSKEASGKLGIISINCHSSEEAEPPPSFVMLLKELEDNTKIEEEKEDKHVCPPDTSAPESEHLDPPKILPKEIQKIIDGYPNVKDHLGKGDRIRLDLVRGMSGKATVDIHVKPNATPKRSHSFRSLPLAYRKAEEDLYNRLISSGVVRKVAADEKCDWVSPSRCLLKPSSTPSEPRLRLVSDMRGLNKNILRTPNPFPDLEKIKDAIPENAKMFLKMDICSGYHQIPISKKSQSYLNFTSPMGLLRYQVAPMGCRSSGDVFTHITQEIFRDVVSANFCLAIDDILLTAPDMKEMKKGLREILAVGAKYGVIFARSKFEFGTEIDFCGLHIERSKKTGRVVISPSPSLIKALEAVEVPTTKRQLRAFLGLTAQLAKFTQRYATLSKPLNELTGNADIKSWTAAHTEAFYRLRRHLLEPNNSLHIFNVREKILIQTDMSQKEGPGFGALLFNVNSDYKPGEDNQEKRLVGIDSAVIPLAKRNIGSSLLELGAIAHALKRFHNYCMGSQDITVECDNDGACRILKKDFCDLRDPVVIALVSIIIRYDVNVYFVPGVRNTAADMLSRQPLKVNMEKEVLAAMDTTRAICHLDVLCINNSMEVSVNSNIKLDFLERNSGDDEEYLQILEAVNKGTSPQNLDQTHPIKKWKLDMSGLQAMGNRKLLTYRTRVFVPKGSREDVLEALHEPHCGLDRIIQAAKVTLFWPDMEKDITAKHRECDVCEQYENAKGPNTPRLTPTEKTASALKPLEHLEMDFLEPRQGLTFLVLVCLASNFIFAENTRNKQSSTVVEAMESIFTKFGYPNILSSDNAAYFTGAVIEQYYKKNGIQHICGAPYYSNHQASAERAVGIVRKLFMKSRLTSTSLSRLIFLQNVIPSAGGVSAFQILFNRPANYTIALPTPDEIISPMEQRRRMQLIRDIRIQRLGAKALPNRQTLNIGTKVRIFNKNTKCWDQQGVVVERIRNSAYIVEFSSGAFLARHQRFLKPFP